jgi:penicillin-binding protein 2
MSPRYYREYPSGRLAGHVLGYVGRRAPLRAGPVENGDFLFTEEEGREGLEAVFDAVLSGEPGTMTVDVSQSGEVVHRRMSVPPVPGKNVVTSLDIGMQKILEQVLSSTGRPAVGVIVDPSNGDILAAASTPDYEPSAMSPARSSSAAPLLSDPAAPLLPRAFRGSYPPASAFKPFVALAAMGSGSVGPEEKIGCPSSLKVGNTVFRNWSSSDSGPMDVAEALSSSCNTWFYRAALKTGAAPLVRVASEFGFGRPPVVLFPHPAPGLIPDDKFMMSRHGRRILPGDAVNMSIGQGDVLVTPLQMAMAYAALGSGGVLYRPRLVLQVQEIDNRVVSGYAPRPRRLQVSPPLLDAVVRGLEGAVKHGTARSAAVPGLQVAGKTGTAQWGPESERKRLAWFCGFAPSRDPEIAFAFLIEGRPGQTLAGSDAAYLAGKVLRRLKSEGFVSERKPSPTPSPKDRDREAGDGEDESPISPSSMPEEVYEQPSVDLTPFLEPGRPIP